MYFENDITSSRNKHQQNHTSRRFWWLAGDLRIRHLPQGMETYWHLWSDPSGQALVLIFGCNDWLLSHTEITICCVSRCSEQNHNLWCSHNEHDPKRYSQCWLWQIKNISYWQVSFLDLWLEILQFRLS
jgi:hypothetical protein